MSVRKQVVNSSKAIETLMKALRLEECEGCWGPGD